MLLDIDYSLPEPLMADLLRHRKKEVASARSSSEGYNALAPKIFKFLRDDREPGNMHPGIWALTKQTYWLLGG